MSQLPIIYTDAESIKKKLLKAVETEGELILGIDEAGRGEGFGSFVVAGVLGKSRDLRQLRDSKKTRDLKAQYLRVKANSKAIFVFSHSAKEIDALREKGMTMNEITARIIDKIVKNSRQKGQKARILVDGSPLKVHESDVEFLPKGDDLEPVIGAASIVAKFEREKSKDRGKRKSWKS